ncbi:hypothetical protein SAY87_009895 [Trapa incisa]|uniref:FAE domain-containing protein n=1 Tax=Trapa incisa TaxID=236973 RepID=A0AAN7GNQ9_9MYRT|nr:hypothetical protein SAY87_009895 [Trapa incisa]
MKIDPSGLSSLVFFFIFGALLFIRRRLMVLSSLSGANNNTDVYLVDFSCFKPPDFCRVPFNSFLEHASMIGIFDRDSIEFMAKILTSSGQGEETYLPPALHSSDDRAYNSAIREEDSKGKLGVTLKRDLLLVAGEALRSNVTILGSTMFPLAEKCRHAVSVIWRRYFNKSAEIYVPNFKTVIQHFCLPTSGRSLITEIAKANQRLVFRPSPRTTMGLRNYNGPLSLTVQCKRTSKHELSV